LSNYIFTFEETSFKTNEIRERDFQKEPNSNDVFICYCFKHTVGEILYASPDNLNEILGDITTGTQFHNCACDIRNPHGSCCIGNTQELIDGLKRHGSKIYLDKKFHLHYKTIFICFSLDEKQLYNQWVSEIGSA